MGEDLAFPSASRQPGDVADLWASTAAEDSLNLIPARVLVPA